MACLHPVLGADLAHDLAGGGLDVGGGEQIGDDDDTARAGGDDLRERPPGDAADAEGGDFRTDFTLHGGDFIEADGGAAGLGGRGEKWAEADVVEALGEGGAGLREGMGGAAEDDLDWGFWILNDE